MNFSEKLGNKINAEMQKTGINCKVLSQKMGYTEKDINRMINGDLIITPKRLNQIIDILGIDKSIVENTVKEIKKES